MKHWKNTVGTCALSSLFACTLNTSGHDGLVFEPVPSRQSSHPTEDGGGDRVEQADASVEASPEEDVDTSSCPNFEGFVASVSSELVDHCIRCHDGRKGKATLAFPLDEVEDESTGAQLRSCLSTLDGVDEADFSQSSILTEVDPTNMASNHDFKYRSYDDFLAYQVVILNWLRAP